MNAALVEEEVGTVYKNIFFVDWEINIVSRCQLKNIQIWVILFFSSMKTERTIKMDSAQSLSNKCKFKIICLKSTHSTETLRVLFL